MPMPTPHITQSRSSFTSTSRVDVSPSFPISSNKRKRDSFDDESDAVIPAQRMAASPSPAAKEEPLYDDGMAMPNPSNGRPMSAEHQTGTQLDEKLDEDAEAVAHAEEVRTQAEEESKALPRRKYQRREPSTVKDAMTNRSPKVAVDEPVIDQFTHLLGVGWTRIGSDPDVQKATRGWVKFIENHYQLQDVEILLTSKALEGASLVFAREGSTTAQEGYFLFSETLSEGRLVADNWETCVGRLQSSPINFQTDETLKAAKTPTLTATRVGGVCAMLPGPDASLATLPTDDLMVCD